MFTVEPRVAVGYRAFCDAHRCCPAVRFSRLDMTFSPLPKIKYWLWWNLNVWPFWPGLLVPLPNDFISRWSLRFAITHGNLRGGEGWQDKLVVSIHLCLFPPRISTTFCVVIRPHVACSRDGKLIIMDIRKNDLVSATTYFGNWELCKEVR